MPGRKKDEAKLEQPIGERLRRVRLSRGFTLERLSRESGIPSSTIWKYENARVSYSLFTILRLSEALGLEPGFLLRKGSAEEGKVSAAGAGEGIVLSAPRAGWSYRLFTPRITGQSLYVGQLTLRAEAVLQLPRALGGEMVLEALEGEMELSCGEWQQVVSPGGCLYFRTDHEGSLHNTGGGEATALISSTSLPLIL